MNAYAWRGLDLSIDRVFSGPQDRISASLRLSLSCASMRSPTPSSLFAPKTLFMAEMFSGTASGCANSAGMGVSRASSLDVLKCAAAFFVVCIHYGERGISPIVRCAVPIFFVITGYYYPMMVEKGKFWKHIRKLLMMVICASALYGINELQTMINLGTLDKWISNTFRLKSIVGMIVYNGTLFGFHLWYFYAALYCLIIFHYADKWRLTKWLRYASPLLLLVLFFSNFKPIPHVPTRTFLFMGLPCMMIGRCIRENNDKAFRFLSNERYLWIFTFGSLLLAYGEMFLFRTMYHDRGAREMYIFTLPVFLPYFYWALRHPQFGEGSWMAIIGRKYSAYIYIFHILVGRTLLLYIEKGDSLLIKAAYPFMVFTISLCVSWLFVRLLQWAKRCHLASVKRPFTERKA